MNVALPQFPSELTELKQLKQLIRRDQTLTTASIHDEDISNLTVKGFSAFELKLEKINFTQAKLEKSGFIDTAITNCDLIATSFADSSWLRTVIKNSRCSGLQIQASTLKDITFLDCKLNLSNFRFSKLTNVHFKDCMLDEADFYTAELNNVYFQNCTLDKAEFSSAKLKKADFRTSEITNVLGVRSLAGAIIDSMQLVSLAPVLANELNIVVLDE